MLFEINKTSDWTRKFAFFPKRIAGDWLKHTVVLFQFYECRSYYDPAVNRWWYEARLPGAVEMYRVDATDYS